MLKSIKIIALILAILLMSSVIIADGAVTKELTKEEAVKILKKDNIKSQKKLAKEANMDLEAFKKLQDKAQEAVEVTPQELVALRGAGCMICQQGILVNQGNECLESKPTGNQRKCIHRYRYGVDVEYEKSCQATVVCNNCGYSSTARWTEKEWKCRGFSE